MSTDSSLTDTLPEDAAQTVATAAAGIPGVHALGSLLERASDAVRERVGLATRAPGVKVDRARDGHVTAAVSIVVDYPHKLHEVSDAVRGAARRALVGLAPGPVDVDVLVTGVWGPFDTDLVEEAEAAVDRAADAASDAADRAGEAVRKAGSSIGDAVEDAADRVGDAVRKAGVAAGDAVEDAADAADAGLRSATDARDDAATDAREDAATEARAIEAEPAAGAAERPRTPAESAARVERLGAESSVEEREAEEIVAGALDEIADSVARAADDVRDRAADERS